MNSYELGKKIKEARISKKMTQSEVVGSFITRNMLSQIENGLATPSIKTLEYLSDVLDIPLPSFDSDPRESSLKALTRAKEALKKKDWEAILAAADVEIPELYDEFCALKSLAFIAMAEEAYNSGDFITASDLSQKAREYALTGVYKNETISAEASLLFHKAAIKLTD